MKQVAGKTPRALMGFSLQSPPQENNDGAVTVKNKRSFIPYPFPPLPIGLLSGLHKKQHIDSGCVPIPFIIPLLLPPPFPHESSLIWKRDLGGTRVFCWNGTRRMVGGLIVGFPLLLPKFYCWWQDAASFLVRSRKPFPCSCPLDGTKPGLRSAGPN